MGGGGGGAARDDTCIMCPSVLAVYSRLMFAQLQTLASLCSSAAATVASCPEVKLDLQSGWKDVPSMNHSAAIQFHSTLRA